MLVETNYTDVYNDRSNKDNDIYLLKRLSDNVIIVPYGLGSYEDLIKSKIVKVIKPIIISETEPITYYDNVFDGKEIGEWHKWDKPNKSQPDDVFLMKFSNGEILERNISKCYKIISLPENLTYKTLQHIERGIFKHNQIIAVECELQDYPNPIRSQYDTEKKVHKWNGHYQVKINNKCVNLFKSKPDWDDIVLEYKKYTDNLSVMHNVMAFKSWLENHYEVPNKIINRYESN